MQEGIGDELVSNAATEALAAAGGLSADQAMSDPGGVSGLWRFAPPGGHGIFSRPDVREQAMRFLASSGTMIIAEGCRSSAVCLSFERCVAPGGFGGCGSCQYLEDECSADADCAARGPGLICKVLPPPPCPCSGVSVLACLSACAADTDCAMGERCAETGHCAATPCAGAGECPAHFACTGGSESERTCARRDCSLDADCGAGFCVLGLCYGQLGSCEAPPP
jgi:hypothetical protein